MLLIRSAIVLGTLLTDARREAIPDLVPWLTTTSEPWLLGSWKATHVLFIAVFISWFHAAYAGVPERRVSQRWALVSWFVPVINWFVPPVLVQEIRSFHGRPSAWLVAGWWASCWASWLPAMVIYTIGPIQQRWMLVLLHAAVYTFDAIAAVLAVSVTRCVLRTAER